MKKYLLTILCVLTMACGSKTNLNGEYKMVDAPENAEITLSIDGNSFAGQSAVNRYFGTLKQDGKNIKFDVAGLTMMAGPESLMEIETQYIKNLEQVEAWELKDGKLILLSKDGAPLVFKK